MKTRIVVTKKPNEEVVEEHDLSPGDKEVLVKTYLASICGTDKNYLEGKMPRKIQVEQVGGNQEAHHAYPLKMGHEAACVIVEVGDVVVEVGVVLKETGDQGADVVIEVAGNDSAIQKCSDLLKQGGILGLYSWVLEPARLYINRWHNDGFDIRTLALMNSIKIDRLWWIEKAMQNVANGMVRIDRLISHVFDLAAAAKAFDVACNDPDACKVMLRP